MTVTELMNFVRDNSNMSEQDRRTLENMINNFSDERWMDGVESQQIANEY